MKKVYLAPAFCQVLPYIKNGIAADAEGIGIGSGQGGDNDTPDPSPSGGYNPLGKERYDVDKVEYGNLW